MSVAVLVSALGRNGKAVADDQHPDHQFRINRGTADQAIERLQLCPDAIEIEKAVDLPKHGALRNMIIQAEVVKDLLRYRLLTRHLIRTPRISIRENGITSRRTDQGRLNQQNRSEADLTTHQRRRPLTLRKRS